MAYDLKITGLANKDALKQEGAKDHRLYKFALSAAPDGFWVLLLQQAAREAHDVTVSGSAGQTELWATANADVSVKRVLEAAKQAVRSANRDANASDAQFKRAAEEKAASLAAYQDRFVAELDELDFEDAGADAAAADGEAGAEPDGGGPPSP